MNAALQAPQWISDTASRVDALLDIVRAVVTELHPAARAPAVIGLDAMFDRDLGVGGLVRIELLLRVERAFGITLPENTLQLAEPRRDLLAALRSASATAAPVRTAVARAAAIQVQESGKAEPADAETLFEALDWHLREHADRTQIVYLADGGVVADCAAHRTGGAAANSPPDDGWHGDPVRRLRLDSVLSARTDHLAADRRNAPAGVGEQFVPRAHLQRLGAEFVGRATTQQSAEDANRMADVVAKGRSLAFFPEGTFTRMPGLLPFHLGAFAAAGHLG